MNQRTLVERAERMINAVERLEDRRDEVVDQLLSRARLHAQALDPTGSKYLRFRVPSYDISMKVDERAQTVTLSGLVSRQGGPDSETWTMPLGLANAADPEAWLADTRARAEADARHKAERERQAREAQERAERAELARLQRKYGAQA